MLLHGLTSHQTEIWNLIDRVTYNKIKTHIFPSLFCISHAPTCLSIEIWTWDDINNKTIDLLCKESPYHGQGHILHDKFDEEGYIAIPICLWGMHPPFEKPPLVSGVPLFVKATTNNTYGHHGEMALPQMLLAHM